MKKSSSAGKSGQPNGTNISEHDIPPPDSNTTATPSILPSPVTSRASSAAGVSRPSSAAAVAFQQASVAYHEAVMAKRLDIVQEMQASLTDTTTVAYQSVAAYSYYLEGLHFTQKTLAYLLQSVLLPDHVKCAHSFNGHDAIAHVSDMARLHRNTPVASLHKKDKAKAVNLCCCCRYLSRFGF